MAILLAGGCEAYPSPGRTRKPDGEFYDIVPPMGTGTPTDAGGEYVERARRLAPQIEDCADQIEQERRLVGPVLDALFEAGMFRLLLPRSLDGAEVDPATFAQVIEEIAKADASTAWCMCQASGCSMSAAYLPPDVAAEVFGKDRRAVLAWGPGPDSRAVAVDGGYRVTGTWSFASGCRHATWLGGHCPIYAQDGSRLRTGGGKAVERTMLFPAASARIVDVWHVSGLKGTGSDAFTVSDLFVPHEYSISRDDPAERRQPGPLYCFPTGSLYASGFASVRSASPGACWTGWWSSPGRRRRGDSSGRSATAR